MSALGIIGAGAFGTALADVVAAAGRTKVQLVPLGSDLAAVARACRLLVLAVPSTQLRQAARELGSVVDGRHILVHTSGVLINEHGQRVSELLREETSARRIGVLAGPAQAHDLVDRQPCGVVVASAFDEVIAEARRALAAPVLRIYGSHDLVGVELAAAVSGALTVALGFCDGLGLGPGPRAILICRGVAEGARLLAAAGGHEQTFGGLAGLGNLLVRASARGPGEEPRGQDYLLGLKLARGEAPARPQSEGTRAAAAVERLARRLQVRTPILDAVTAVVQRGVPVKQVAAQVMETSADDVE